MKVIQKHPSRNLLSNIITGTKQITCFFALKFRFQRVTKSLNYIIKLHIKKTTKTI